MYVYFARHGESQANILKVFANEGTGYGLTDKGKAQAAELAESLKGKGIAKAFASPLTRSQETAEIVCTILGIEFETSHALKEIGVGAKEGSCDPAAWSQYREVEKQWLTETQTSARIGGGECLLDVRNRFDPFIRQTIEQYKAEAQAILFIGHGGTLACGLSGLLVNVDSQFAYDHPIKPAGLIVARTEGKDLYCLSWTETTFPELELEPA